MECHTCGNRGKYVCPARSARSCSLECVKKHKENTNSTGQVDPTEFVPKQKLFTPTGLDRDYNFLQTISRQITVHKQDTSQKVYKPRDQWRAGVRVRAMGPGMSRVTKNKSKWNNQAKVFEWTTEFKLGLEGKDSKYLQVPDSTKVSALPALAEIRDDMDVFVRDPFGNRTKLDATLSFKDALKGKMVLEFPTIEFQEKIESSSSSDTTSSSDSDSDSDSDSESDTGTGSGDEKDKAQGSANDGNNNNNNNNKNSDDNRNSNTNDQDYTSLGSNTNSHLVQNQNVNETNPEFNSSSVNVNPNDDSNIIETANNEVQQEPTQPSTGPEVVQFTDKELKPNQNFHELNHSNSTDDEPPLEESAK